MTLVSDYTEIPTHMTSTESLKKILFNMKQLAETF